MRLPFQAPPAVLMLLIVAAGLILAEPVEAALQTFHAIAPAGQTHTVK